MAISSYISNRVEIFVKKKQKVTKNEDGLLKKKQKVIKSSWIIH
jgi:hypothetical protein